MQHMFLDEMERLTITYKRDYCKVHTEDRSGVGADVAVRLLYRAKLGCISFRLSLVLMLAVHQVGHWVVQEGTFFPLLPSMSSSLSSTSTSVRTLL